MQNIPRDEKKKRELFLDRLAHIFKTDRAFVEQFLYLNRTQSLRLNNVFPDSDNLKAELESEGIELQPIDWCPHAYTFFGNKRDITGSDYFRDGRVIVQNASSFIPPICLDPRPNDYILDMCAAPGSKTSHIAALCGNLGHIWVNEVSIERVRIMKEYFNQTGVSVEMIFNQAGQFLHETISRKFDRILLDAPCSSEGIIDFRKPNAMQYWSASTIKKHHELQLELMVSAVNLLSPQGTLVYSTCTFAPEENEEIIDFALKTYPNLMTVPIDIDLPNRVPALTSWQSTSFDPQVKNGLRIMPSPEMEGFFVCVMQFRS
ncbi:RsmB/NOP family class I SAM-dependent RNA methyltransferase [candidate division WWE3 bacterium]|nr:RsmB/NOP family class I SAM-dependent RNA methyltransferase [candidate division WWE3 bacterium]